MNFDWPAVSLDTEAEVGRFVRAFIQETPSLPFPGSGQTEVRWKALSAFGAFNLSVAKLLESHFDALAILNEAGLQPRPGLYAVWASRFGGGKLEIKRKPQGWLLTGELPFASGYAAVDQALVSVPTSSGEMLFQVPQSAFTKRREPSWNIPHMAEAGTVWLSVCAELTEADQVGGGGFYLNRAGFWPGAIGVAACWLGAAQSLHKIWQLTAQRKAYEDPHEKVQLASFHGRIRSCSLHLIGLAKLVDQGHMSSLQGQREALAIRALVDEVCNELIFKAMRASGPGLLLFNPTFRKTAEDLMLFTRQSHAEKDLMQLHATLSTFKGDWFES